MQCWRMLKPLVTSLLLTWCLYPTRGVFYLPFRFPDQSVYLGLGVGWASGGGPNIPTDWASSCHHYYIGVCLAIRPELVWPLARPARPLGRPSLTLGLDFSDLLLWVLLLGCFGIGVCPVFPLCFIIMETGQLGGLLTLLDINQMCLYEVVLVSIDQEAWEEEE